MSDELPDSFPASGPAREARRLLSSALESLQLFAGQTADVRRALEATAAASSELYSVEMNQAPGGAGFDRIRQAIEHLGRALETLQKDGIHDPAVLATTETIARTLALLYPVARAQQRARKHVVYPHGNTPEQESALEAEVALPARTVPPAPPAGRPRIHTPGYRGAEHRARGDRVFVEADIGLLSDSHFYTGLSQDLSTGGVFIATYQPKPEGTRVGLYFALPGGHVVEARGVVRWTRPGGPETPPGMGVAFEDLSPEDLEAIHRFCQEREPLYHDSADP